jgi:tetratricopeptide (TPR) repeat protein
MDIQKKGSCRLIFCISLVVAIILVGDRVSLAAGKTSAEVLIATYRSSATITPAEAKSAVARLVTVLADCEDIYLAFRIKYRIGVMYFKAGMMRMSKARFLQIANDSKCPELIRACSFNMIGQISRLGAENKEALEAFNQVANLLEQRSFAGREYTPNSTLTKLWCSALLSKAEIFEFQQDYTASITEYSRLLHALSQNKNKDMSSLYAPLANYKISQLYLQRGDIDKYIEIVEALTGDYPEYHRTPLVKLELECIKFMKSISANLEFLKDGSFAAPAHLIANLKDSKSGTSAESIVNEFDELCSKYQNTCEGIFLQYHYAWLLDALGKKHKAAEILARIFTMDIAYTSNKSQEKVIAEIVREYAKIQYAIMAGEKADYKEALKVLGSLPTDPDKSHISELVKSVNKSIQILKREVPKNENK